MRVVALTPYLNSSGGGLYDAVRRPAVVLQTLVGLNVEVVSVATGDSASDIATWEPVSPRIISPLANNPFRYAPGLLDTLDAIDADLVHVHGLWLYYGLAARLWAKRRRRPYVISPHGMLDGWALRQSRLKKLMARWLFERLNLADAACVHALNRAEVAAIRDYHCEAPICVIPNGVDLPAAADRRVPNWKTRIPQGKKLLLFLGRLHAKKGLMPLLEAWGSAHRLSPECAGQWHLIVAGTGDERFERQLLEKIGQIRVRESVTMIGGQFGDQRQETYLAADAFILPSHSEGFPLTVLEAWAHRLPVLATKACNLEIGYEVDAAVEVSAAPDILARQLIQFFLMPPQQRALMGKRGYELAAQRFTWTRVARDFYDVYQWLVDGTRRPNTVET
jgi:glycosyltransferase involved in cell wall biosynthesis